MSSCVICLQWSPYLGKLFRKSLGLNCLLGGEILAMTTIRITRTANLATYRKTVQGETIGNLNIPAVLEYRVKTTTVSAMYFSVGKLTLVFKPAKSLANLGANCYPWLKYMIQFFPKEKIRLKLR
jgi:hypothetical protein